MNLKLLRLKCVLPMKRDYITTLQIEDRGLFARIASSLLSEKGQYAVEPYMVFDNKERPLSPKGALRVVETLPLVPALDRGLQAKLFRKIRSQVDVNPTDFLRLNDLMGQVNAIIEEASGGLHGDYCLTREWDIETYLKGFGFTVASRDDLPLLDKCIRFLGLCADLEPEVPVVFLNAKSFFSSEELCELFDNAIFAGIRLVLMESWPDARCFACERKQVIDQHFLLE